MNAISAEFRDGSPLAQAKALFKQAFGAEPAWAVRAPGRVNLIGEHTDYNDGFVLPCAIDFHTVAAVTPRSDAVLRVVAHGHAHSPVSVALDQPLQPGSPVDWLDYVKAMWWVWQQTGRRLPGADVALAGNVPQGAGLSSSASLEVALGFVLRELMQTAGPSAQEIALMAQRAENEFVGCHCGNMDQLISAQGRAGHAMLIDCRSLELTPVALPDDLAIIVIDSKVQRGLVDSHYNLRRQQCEAVARHFDVPALRDLDLERLHSRASELEPTAFRRARHVVSENERTRAAASALRQGDLLRLGQLMAQSHQSMRDDFEITVPPIDRIVECVAGALEGQGGVRMTGGGFGGCVVAVAPLTRVAAVLTAVERGYRAPGGQVAPVYVCKAQAGAGRLDGAQLQAA